MEFLEEPRVTDRNEVLKDAALRNVARTRLVSHFATAKVSLSPRNQLNHFLDRNQKIAKTVIKEAKIVARKSAPVVGTIGIGVLLFAARRPISKWISGLKRPTTQDKD
ncbi:MAG: hypothetical protein WBO17_07690 [Sphingorhabdus sp.]